MFIDNPEWSDLKVSTALRIALHGGPGLIRIAHHHNPKTGPRMRELVISTDEYRVLVAEIESELAVVTDGGSLTPLQGNSPDDRYYAARGRYTLANTCNQWTSDRLAASGIRTGVWTPLAGGVMKWVPEGP